MEGAGGSLESHERLFSCHLSFHSSPQEGVDNSYRKIRADRGRRGPFVEMPALGCMFIGSAQYI